MHIVDYIVIGALIACMIGASVMALNKAYASTRKPTDIDE
jgi:hypothetical protein